MANLPFGGISKKLSSLRFSLGGVKPAVPAEVVVEILCRHAMETVHPLLQPPVIGIDVVDVVGAGSLLLGVRGHRPNLHSFLVLGDGPVGGRPVRQQNRVLGDFRGQGGGYILTLS